MSLFRLFNAVFSTEISIFFIFSLIFVWQNDNIGLCLCCRTILALKKQCLFFLPLGRKEVLEKGENSSQTCFVSLIDV